MPLHSRPGDRVNRPKIKIKRSMNNKIYTSFLGIETTANLKVGRNAISPISPADVLALSYR